MPGLDADIGIRIYTTGSAGCGGRIKENIGDFAVSEELRAHALDHISQDSGYAVYVMRKAGIDTAHALRRAQKQTGQRLKALGLKDARATTQQYVCATSRSARLAEYSDGTVSLDPVGYVPRPLSGRDMAGNAFAIKVTGHDGSLAEFAEWEKILNFYAYQRFGSAHAVTHLVGRAIVLKDWRRAADLLLGFSAPYEPESAAGLRRRISECKTYAEMLEVMPHSMDIERTLAGELGRGAEPLDALRRLPVQIRRLYVQAYQSYIFNSALSSLAESGEPLEPHQGDVCYGADDRLCRYGKKGDMLAMPLVGHSYYPKTRFAGAIRDVLVAEGITPGDFAVRDMQEAAAEGGFRTVAIGAVRPTIDSDTIHVTLRRGSYATALLREVIKPEDPVSAGLAA